LISIEEFKQQIRDFVRPNRFLVFVQSPFGSLSEEERILCQSSSIPDYQISSIELKYLGNTIKIGGDYNFSSITLTFLNDYEFKVRKFFEKWIKGISSVNFENNLYINEYLSNSIIKLHQLGRNFEILRTYVFYYCLPVNLSNIELNMESNNQIESFSVEIQYGYWDVK